MIDLGIKSVNELSEKSNVSKPTIYEYFNGKTPITNSFEKLCDYLEIEAKSAIVKLESSEDQDG